MLTQITDYGTQLIQNAVSPIILTSFKLGSGFGYVPTTDQTDIQGSLIYTGVPSAPYVETANFVQYSVALGSSVGPFQFGEIALFHGTELFAISVLDQLMLKTPLDVNNNTGGAIVIDFNVPSMGLTYQIWANVTQANVHKIASIGGPEELPQRVGQAPNIYVIDSIDGTKPFLGYTDRDGLWAFDTYAVIGRATTLAATQTSVTISASEAAELEIAVGPIESVMVQVVSGPSSASVRWVTQATLAGVSGNIVLHLNSPIFTTTAAGDLLEFYKLGASATLSLNVSALLTIKNVTGDYTLEPGDEKAVYIRVSSPTPATVYVPSDDVLTFPNGTNLLVGWAGPGQISVAPLNGNVEVLTPSTLNIAQFNGKLALIKVAPNLWEIEGNLQQ